MSIKVSLKMAFRKNLYPDITFFHGTGQHHCKSGGKLYLAAYRKPPYLNWLEVEKRWNDLFLFLNIGFLYTRQPSAWLDQCHHRCISLSEATARRSIDRPLTGDRGSSHLTLDRRQQFQSCTITRLSLTQTDAMTNILFGVGFHFQLFKFVRYLIVLMVSVLNF